MAKFTETEVLAILRGIYSGEINPVTLPPSVYTRIGAEFEKKARQGFGKGFEAGSSRAQKLDDLLDNLWSFSAAKTYQQVAQMSLLRIASDGSLVPFEEFEAQAGAVFETFNKTYQSVEVTTTSRQAIAARKWLDIEEQVGALGLLRYVTVGDDRVRDEHITMDGITRPVKDDFWNTFYPPNGFRCRCIVQQFDEGDKKITEKLPQKLAEPHPLFKSNVGKTGKVFSEKHPYFKAPKNLKENNFGLTRPENG